MSNVTIIQTHNEIFIGADSAVSVNYNGLSYRLNYNGEKLFVVDDMVIFCSGRMSLSYKVIDKFKTSSNRTMSELQKIAVSEYTNHSFDESEIGLEIVVGKIDFGKSVLYQLSPYNNFKIIKKEVLEGSIAIWSGGIKTKESSELLYDKIKNGNNFIESIVDVFSHISCEEIGGILSVYKIADRISKILEVGITEKNNLRYIEDVFIDNKNLVIAERLIGQIIAGNNLIITNTSGSFTIDDNGATATDMEIVVTNTQKTGRIFISPSQGFKIQKNTGATASPVWSDQIVMSSNGDVVFKGQVSIGSGNSIFKADTNGIYLGNSVFNNAPFSVDPLGNLKSSKINVTGGTMNIGNNFGVDAQGNLTAKNANLSGNINMTTGNISWSNVNTDPVATSAGNMAGMAYNTAQQIAAGTYTGGTFINGKIIYSPTIMTGTSGRYLKLEGSKLESVNSGTKNGISLDGSDGSIKWYNNNNQVGSISTFRNTNYDTLTVQHNAINLYGEQAVIINSGYDIQIGASSGFTTFTGNVSFSNATSVTGITAKFG